MEGLWLCDTAQCRRTTSPESKWNRQATYQCQQHKEFYSNVILYVIPKIWLEFSARMNAIFIFPGLWNPNHVHVHTLCPCYPPGWQRTSAQSRWHTSWSPSTSSQPELHTPANTHTHNVKNRLNYNTFLLNEVVILLLDRDLQDEWGTRCSFQHCICNSWWGRCYFCILHTNACTASQSNCGCHNTGAAEINRIQILN